MHKPTLLKVLRMLKDLAPENPQISRDAIEHVVSRSVAQDTSLEPAKLLAGAGITL